MKTISKESTGPQPDDDWWLDWLESIDKPTTGPRRHRSLCEPILLAAALAIGPDVSRISPTDGRMPSEHPELKPKDLT